MYSWEAPPGFADAQASTGGWAAVVDSAVSIVSLSVSFFYSTNLSYLYLPLCNRLERPTTIIVLQTPHRGMFPQGLTLEEVM